MRILRTELEVWCLGRLYRGGAVTLSPCRRGWPIRQFGQLLMAISLNRGERCTAGLQTTCQVLDEFPQPGGAARVAGRHTIEQPRGPRRRHPRRHPPTRRRHAHPAHPPLCGARRSRPGDPLRSAPRDAASRRARLAEGRARRRRRRFARTPARSSWRLATSICSQLCSKRPRTKSIPIASDVLATISRAGRPPVPRPGPMGRRRCEPAGTIHRSSATTFSTRSNNRSAAMRSTSGPKFWTHSCSWPRSTTRPFSRFCATPVTLASSPMVDALTTSEDSGIMERLVELLRDTDAPTAALEVIAKRGDQQFLEHPAARAEASRSAPRAAQHEATCATSSGWNRIANNYWNSMAGRKPSPSIWPRPATSAATRCSNYLPVCCRDGLAEGRRASCQALARFDEPQGRRAGAGRTRRSGRRRPGRGGAATPPAPVARRAPAAGWLARCSVGGSSRRRPFVVGGIQFCPLPHNVRPAG